MKKLKDQTDTSQVKVEMRTSFLKEDDAQKIKFLRNTTLCQMVRFLIISRSLLYLLKFLGKFSIRFLSGTRFYWNV